MVRADWLPKIDEKDSTKAGKLRGVFIPDQWGELLSNDLWIEEVRKWKLGFPTFLCSHCRKAVGVSVTDITGWEKKTQGDVFISGKHVTGPDPFKTGPKEGGGTKQIQIWPDVLEAKD